MARCTAAFRTDEFHGWGCNVSGDSCMFLVPNSKACAEQFGEGPDADKRRPHHGAGRWCWYPG